jgi:hypothetical protein
MSPKARGGQAVAKLDPESLLPVGSDGGGTQFHYLKKIPREFYGAEGAPDFAAKAQARDIKISSFDLSKRWPCANSDFDPVFSSPIIQPP